MTDPRVDPRPDASARPRRAITRWTRGRDAEFGRNRFSECMRFCRRLLVHEPDDRKSLQLLSRIHANRERMVETVHLLDRLRCLMPGNPFVMGALARANFAMDKFVDAEHWCRASLLLDDTIAERWLDLARILRARERYDVSRDAMSRAVSLDKSFALQGRVLALTVTPDDFQPRRDGNGSIGSRDSGGASKKNGPV